MRKVVRENDARTARINPQSIVGQGSFKDVCSGEYIDGDRHGQPCVAKTMRDHPNCAKAFDKELEIIQKARELIKKFNDTRIIDKRVVLNIPEVWEDERQNRVLVEPFLKHFENFNSNTGHVTESTTPWARVMQALSHFSYHVSSGQFLLCDLQGAVYRHELVLTDPVVLSRNGRFGPTDLGSEGMENFFHWHTCTDYCHPNWQVPKKARYYHQPRLGTSMTDGRNFIVPTRSTRSSLDTAIPSLQATASSSSSSHTASASSSQIPYEKERGLETDPEPDTPSRLVTRCFNAVFSDDKRADTVDYRPARGPSPAQAQPWLPGHLAGSSQGPAEPQCSDSMRVGSLTEPAPTQSARHHPFDNFVPAPSAATAPAQMFPSQEFAEMAARVNDPDAPRLSDFTGLTAQSLQQPVPNSMQDMLQQGQQFVQQAAESGMLGDAAEVASRFLLPRPAPEYTTRFTRQSQQHVAQNDVQSESAGMQGGAVLDMLRNLLHKPSYTDDDLVLIQDIDLLSQQLVSRLQQLAAEQQPPASAPIQPPPALTPVVTPQSVHWNTQHEAPMQAVGRPEVPADSVQLTSAQSQAVATGGMQPSTSPQQHFVATSPLVGPQNAPEGPHAQQQQTPLLARADEQRTPGTSASPASSSVQEQPNTRRGSLPASAGRSPQQLQIEQEIERLQLQQLQLQQLQARQPSDARHDQPGRLSGQHEQLRATSVNMPAQSQPPPESDPASQGGEIQLEQHVATTPGVLEPNRSHVDPSVQQAQRPCADVEGRVSISTVQPQQQNVSTCSLRAPVGVQLHPAVDEATPVGAQATSSFEHGGTTSQQEEDLPVSESPATPSSVSASEVGVARSPMDQLPGISELAEDDLSEAELAAAMRAVLSVRKGRKR